MDKGAGSPHESRDPVGHDDSTRRVDTNERSVLEAELPPRLGPFILGPFLGRGGMGTVYRARHAKTGAQAVVKLVPTSAPPLLIQSLRDEVAGLAKVNVPNIPRVLDQDEEAGFVWMAQELIEGNDLRDFIAKTYHDQSSFNVNFETAESPLTKRSAATPANESGLSAGSSSRSKPTATRRRSKTPELRVLILWFRDLARALHAVHQAGLLHRDIKPANIMLGPNLTPYLVDFGLAVNPSDLEQIVGKQAGTPAYMSPEQARLGWSGLSPATDIYSLAVTFVEVLTGQRVIKANARYDVMDQIQHLPVPTPHEVQPSLPDSLSPIFRRATQKSITDRYTSAADLANDLDAWLQTHRATDSKSKVLSAAAIASLLILFFIWSPWSTEVQRAEQGPKKATVADLIDNSRPEQSWIALGAHARQWGLDEIEKPQVKLFLSEVGDRVSTDMIARQTIELTVPDLVPLRTEVAGASIALKKSGLSSIGLHLTIVWDALMNRDYKSAQAEIRDVSEDKLALLTKSERHQLQALELYLAIKTGQTQRATELREELVVARDPIVTAIQCYTTLNDWNSGIWDVAAVQEHCQDQINAIKGATDNEHLAATLQLMLSLTKQDYADARVTAGTIFLKKINSSEASRERFRAGTQIFLIVSNLGYLSERPEEFEATPEYAVTMNLTRELLREYPSSKSVLVDRVWNYLSRSNPTVYFDWIDRCIIDQTPLDKRTKYLVSGMLVSLAQRCCDLPLRADRIRLHQMTAAFYQSMADPKLEFLTVNQSDCEAQFAWELIDDWEVRGHSFELAASEAEVLIAADRERLAGKEPSRYWWGLAELFEGLSLSNSASVDVERIRAAMTMIETALAKLGALPDVDGSPKLVERLSLILTELERKLNS